MKKFIFTIAAFGLLCSPALAMEKCETEIPDMTKKLQATEKISDNAKKKYTSHLEEALKLCKAGDFKKSDDVLKEMQNQFFRDALYDHQTFYGN
jgi:pentatricopeptide repeat protein